MKIARPKCRTAAVPPRPRTLGPWAGMIACGVWLLTACGPVTNSDVTVTPAIPASTAPPGQATNLTADVFDSGSSTLPYVALRWTAPASVPPFSANPPPAGAATGYKLYCDVVPGFSGSIVITNLFDTVRSATASYLLNNTSSSGNNLLCNGQALLFPKRMYFAVRATNSFGDAVTPANAPLLSAEVTAIPKNFGVAYGSANGKPAQPLFGASVGGGYGQSVAVSGDFAIVGAFRDAGNQGSVQFIERDLNSPIQTPGVDWLGNNTAQTIASPAPAQVFFGWSVGITALGLSAATPGVVAVSTPLAGYAIIGAPRQSNAATATANTGAAYIYERPAGAYAQAWSAGTTPQAAGLLQPANLVSGDLFGYSVAVSGTVALVGAPGDSQNTHSLQGAGAVYAYVRDAAAGWQLSVPASGSAALRPATDVQAFAKFGQAVAVSGSLAVVGAPNSYGASAGTMSNAGEAYVFSRSAAGTWGQAAALLASDRKPNDLLGSAVAIAGKILIVGAPGASVGSNAGAGKAYIFEQQANGTWALTAILTAVDGAAGDAFGSAVSISGGIAAVGASQKTVLGTAKAGQAYLYQRSPSTGAWSQIAPSSPALDSRSAGHPAGSLAASDQYGAAVAISGTDLLVGMPMSPGGNGAVFFY